MKNACANRVAKIVFPVAALAFVLVLSCGDDDPVKPGQPPDITLFTADPGDIMPGDSSLVNYKALRADSLVLSPPGAKLTPSDSGSVYVKPATPTMYTLVAYNKDGVDSATLSIAMTGATAEIVSLSISEATIVRGDSALLSWNTLKADSLVIDNGIGKVGDPDSGSVFVKPLLSIVYTAVAYNVVPDTATATLAVRVPTAVGAVNGLYYKGEMGSSTLSPAMEFAVVDGIGLPIPSQWLYFSTLEGDGALSQDSALSDAAGLAPVSYEFSGALGHAVVRATAPGADSSESIDVYVRANTLIPGIGGQGQYILFNDLYSVVKNFNGNPESVDEDPGYWLNYAVYEAALGVVFMVIDDNQNADADDDESVIGVIVNTVYDKTTPEGIGIGATYPELVAAYGLPERSGFNQYYPLDTILFYDTRGLIFWCNRSDTVVNEIHLVEPLPKRQPVTRVTDSEPRTIGKSPTEIRRYRLHEALR
jgi:hypothetical protein